MYLDLPTQRLHYLYQVFVSGFMLLVGIGTSLEERSKPFDSHSHFVSDYCWRRLNPEAVSFVSIKPIFFH